MENIRKVDQIDIKEKTVLIRVDFNVPMNEQGQITDDSRITKSLDTVKYCISQRAKVVLMAHLGRPKGEVKKEFSLAPVAKHLSSLLSSEVKMMPDCIGEEVKSAVSAMKPGEVVLLENLRFHAEETKNEEDFARQLASLADVYVNDAFGAAHRAHASTAGVTKFLPSVAGYLLAKEIEYLGKAITNPERPFVTILGGAKVSDKVKLIMNLMDKADAILIGGAMAYTFYKVQGMSIGDSKFEPEGEPYAREALESARSKNFQIEFPVDRVVAQSIDKASECKVIETEIPDGWSGFDIGPKTVEQFKEVLSKAKTIVWNGPVGLFEVEEFRNGTRALAEYIAGLDATKIIGGGDTAAAIRMFGLEDKMSHVSTGGGASLEFLEGTVLPGVAALSENPAASSSQS